MTQLSKDTGFYSSQKTEYKKAFTEPASGNNGCGKSEGTYMIKAMQIIHGSFTKLSYKYLVQPDKCLQQDGMKNYLQPMSNGYAKEYYSCSEALSRIKEFAL